ncbi:alpha/beta fold hydrolase [Gynuella sp.]|uniref:alpha/beta fold hydrolase n=1 Tax=Gynuella sp. TaxID=2969146 RepID=UPI003D0B7D34
MHTIIKGKGQPLIIIPGWTGDSAFMAYCYETILKDSGFQRIYLDPPGHGGTTGYHNLENIDQYFQIMLEKIKKLTDGKPFAAMGFSMGGFMVRCLSMELQQQSMGFAMLAPVITLPYEQRILPELITLKDELQQEPLSPLESMYMETPMRTHSLLQFLRAAPSPTFNEANIRLLDKLFLPENYRVSFDPDKNAEQYTRPILCIAGKQDHVVGYQQAGQLCNRYPRATFAALDRAGHWLEEKNAIITALIQEWLMAMKDEL